MDQKIPGYRKKPVWIYLIAFFYFVLPIITLYQFWQHVDHVPELLKPILFSNFFLFDVFASVTAGVAVMIVSRWTFLYFVSLSFYTICVRIHNLRFNALFEYPFDFIVIAFWFGVTILFLFTTLKVPYLNPKTRWWTQPRRFTFFALGAVSYKGVKFPIVTLNFSGGGAFLKLDQRAMSTAKNEGAGFEEKRKQVALGRLLLTSAEIEEARRHLDAYPERLGEKILVQIQTLEAAKEMFPKEILETAAEIVWIPKAGTRYRYAMGIRFIGQSSSDKKNLKRYMKLLKRSGFQEEART